MKYRQLGNLCVSEIGFGAWGIGGLTEGATSYGPTNDNVSRAAIRTALANGINFFDTSNVYGDGHSEELIGEIVNEKRCRGLVVIATKGGLPKHHGQQDLSCENLRKSLEDSLKRLGTSYVDLYQLHMGDHTDFTQVKLGKAYETLCRLKQEGLIREIGISLKSPGDGLIALNMGFKIMQVNFSMMDQRALDGGLLNLAKKKGASLIAKTPFCFGFLTGKITDLNFDPKDHRSTWNRAQLEKWLEGSKIFQELNAQLNKKNGQNRCLYELALKFCLFPKAVSTVIPGIMTPQEAIENAAASARPELGSLEWEQIVLIYKRENEFFVKKR